MCPQKEDPHRICFAVGRNRLDYPGPTATESAEIQTANLLFKSIISTKGGRFMCIDLKDFYLGTPMNRYDYLWIKMANIPQDIIDQYGLTAKAVNGKVLVEIHSGNSERYVQPEASRSNCQRPTHTPPQGLWVRAMQIHSRDLYSRQP